MSAFRVGVIGCGRIAAIYRPILAQLQQNGVIELRSAMDKDLARAADFAHSFPGCVALDCFEQVLEQDLDTVHILTPHFLHAEQAISCLKAGFHVLCEKPIAINLEDADRMMQAEAESGRQLGIIFQNRYLPGVIKAKELLTNGTFGSILGAWSTLHWSRPPSYYACDWKGNWDTEGGGVVIDQAIHSLDLVRYLMGYKAVSVHGHIDRRVLTQIQVEDVANAAITFENQAVYSFYACNYFSHNDPIQIRISCTQGTIHVIGSQVELQLTGQAPIVIAPSSSEISSGKDYWGTCHQQQINDFYTNLQSGTAVLVRPQDAKETLALVQGIYASSYEKRKLLLPKGLPSRALHYL